jgi:tRNA(fMet)-specific endonuclease VapC
VEVKALIDTSAYSALRRNHTGVLAVLQECREVLLTPVVAGELRYGFRGGRQESANAALLSQFVSEPRVKLVHVDFDTADRFAEIQDFLRKNGRPLPTNDIWIAASAMQHGARVLTTDEHFLSIPHVLTAFVGAK